MVEVTSESSIPMDYMHPQKPRPKRTLNKRKLLKALKEKVNVPGCRLADGKRGLIIK